MSDNIIRWWPKSGCTMSIASMDEDHARLRAERAESAALALMMNGEALRDQFQRRWLNAEAELKALREAARDEIIDAYKQGAMDVHQNYQPDRDPDFTEAAEDYYAALERKP